MGCGRVGAGSASTDEPGRVPLRVDVQAVHLGYAQANSFNAGYSREVEDSGTPGLLCVLKESGGLW